MDPLPGEGGVYGEGADAIPWAKVSYLHRVQQAYEREYQKRKAEMGDEPFFFGFSAQSDPWRWLKRREVVDQLEATRAIADDDADALSDVFSLIRITKG